MPPLVEVGKLCAPRVTGNALMEISAPSRSRAPSLPTPTKGRVGRHRLLRVPACKGTMVAPPRLPQAPRMLDEPPALCLLENHYASTCTMRFALVLLLRGW
jgi:hypothetical protein